MNDYLINPNYLSDECCINVHVSALLDHWLDWDRTPAMEPVPSVEPPTSPNIDELISHLATLPDPVARARQYCSNIGCDVINRKDKEGKTILHHLLSGKCDVIVLESRC